MPFDRKQPPPGGRAPEITVEWSDIDGVLVVHIDMHEDAPSNEYGPIMRIWLDDETLYENPGFPGVPGED